MKAKLSLIESGLSGTGCFQASPNKFNIFVFQQGLNAVINYLQQKKQSHPTVVLYNLRNDATVECNGMTFSEREPGALDEPITLRAATAEEVEVSHLDPFTFNFNPL